MRASLTVLALLLLTACSDDKSDPAAPSFVATDCPVPDETFCATAVAAANALAARDSDALLSLSRSDTIVCAEMAVEYFPGCSTNDVLTGYGVSGPDLTVQVLDKADYIVHLRGTTSELNSASLQMLGVGSCGPDTPGRRTYHLAWTAVVTDTDGTRIPIVGRFEFSFVDDWRIALFYVGTVESWDEQPDDVLRDSFCEAGQNPWPF